MHYSVIPIECALLKENGSKWEFQQASAKKFTKFGGICFINQFYHSLIEIESSVGHRTDNYFFTFLPLLLFTFLGDDASHTPTCTSSTTFNCWYQCQEDDILTEERRNYLLDKVIPDATSKIGNFCSFKLFLAKFANLLSVDPVQGKNSIEKL
jgi:hypothetical protein